MFILSKRNITLPSPDDSTFVRVRRDFLGEIPEWATQTAYFAALVKDGKIVPTEKKDKALHYATEKPVKTHRKTVEE